MRALIVDGEELFRLSLNEVVSVAGPFTHISHATSEASFLTITAQIKNVDLVIIHPASIGKEGNDCLTLTRRLYPQAAIICFGAKPYGNTHGDILFLERSLSVNQLVDCIRQALRLPPLSVGRTANPSAPDIQTLVGSPPPSGVTSSDENTSLERLSHRQRQILLMAADGLANKEIAARLGIAEGTVKAHMHAIFKVLGVTNRTQAVVRFGGLAKAQETPSGNSSEHVPSVGARDYRLGA